jgi:hypothetical protein
MGTGKCIRLWATAAALLFLGGPGGALLGETTEVLPDPQLIRERTFSEVPASFYAPQTGRQQVSDFFHDEEITIGAEFLFLTEKVFPEHGMVDVYNAMLGFSKMVGITYYTSRGNRTKTLIYDSYRISYPGSTTALPDIVLQEPESEMRIYVFQDMDEFDELVWEVDYRYDGCCITAVLKNLDPIYMGPFKIVDSGMLSVLLAAVPAGDDVVLYQAGQVYSSTMRTLARLGLKGYLEETFYQRMKAVSTVYYQSGS